MDCKSNNKQRSLTLFLLYLPPVERVTSQPQPACQEKETAGQLTRSIIGRSDIPRIPCRVRAKRNSARSYRPPWSAAKEVHNRRASQARQRTEGRSQGYDIAEGSFDRRRAGRERRESSRGRPSSAVDRLASRSGSESQRYLETTAGRECHLRSQPNTPGPAGLAEGNTIEDT